MAAVLYQMSRGQPMGVFDVIAGVFQLVRVQGDARAVLPPQHAGGLLDQPDDRGDQRHTAEVRQPDDGRPPLAARHVTAGLYGNGCIQALCLIPSNCLNRSRVGL